MNGWAALWIVGNSTNLAYLMAAETTTLTPDDVSVTPSLPMDAFNAPPMRTRVWPEAVGSRWIARPDLTS